MEQRRELNEDVTLLFIYFSLFQSIKTINRIVSKLGLAEINHELVLI